MDIYKPYTYLIGWLNINKWYYGVRFAKNCNPNDFWVNYFTSSKKVKEIRKMYGEPNIIQIRKTFETADKARLWEAKVIKKLNAPSSDKWLNQSDHNDKFYHEGPRGSFTEEHRKKLSIAAIGRKDSPETIANRVAKNTGQKRTPEQLKKMSEAQKNKIYSEQGWNNIIEGNKRKRGSEKAKRASSKAGKTSQQKRKESGYYQSEEWKIAHKKSVEKRRANKLLASVEEV